MTEPPTMDANGRGEGGPPPPAAPPRPWLRTAVIGALIIGWSVVAGLYLSGVIGAVGFWRGMWAVTVLNLYVVLAQNAGLLRGTATDHAMIAELMQLLNAIRVAPSVRCAGCHTVAHLKSGSLGITAAGEAGFPLPPGWEVVNERPYCDTCRARAKTRAN